MGSAFTAADDFYSYYLWNAAGAKFKENEPEMLKNTYLKWNMDLTSLSLGVLLLTLYSNSNNEDESDDETVESIVKLFAFSFRGLTLIRSKNVLVSLNLFEELMDYKFPTRNPFTNCSNSICFSLKPSNQLSLGLSVSAYKIDDDEWQAVGTGYNLGMQYQPQKIKGLKWGISYFRFSQDVKMARSKIERIFNNSFCFGISYRHDDKYLISADIKNLLSFSKGYFGELHFGAEQKLFYNFYLREGFFPFDNNIHKLAATIGIGYQSNFYENPDAKYFDVSIGFLLYSQTPLNQNIVSVSTRIGL